MLTLQHVTLQINMATVTLTCLERAAFQDYKRTRCTDELFQSLSDRIGTDEAESVQDPGQLLRPGQHHVRRARTGASARLLLVLSRARLQVVSGVGSWCSTVALCTEFAIQAAALVQLWQRHPSQQQSAACTPGTSRRRRSRRTAKQQHPKGDSAAVQLDTGSVAACDRAVPAANVADVAKETTAQTPSADAPSQVAASAAGRANKATLSAMAPHPAEVDALSAALRHLSASAQQAELQAHLQLVLQALEVVVARSQPQSRDDTLYLLSVSCHHAQLPQAAGAKREKPVCCSQGCSGRSIGGMSVILGMISDLRLEAETADLEVRHQRHELCDGLHVVLRRVLAGMGGRWAGVLGPTAAEKAAQAASDEMMHLLLEVSRHNQLQHF